MGTDVGTILLAIITTLLTLMLPWAAAVHGRLAKIETTISNGMKDRLHELVSATQETQKRLGHLETQVAVHMRAVDAATAAAAVAVSTASNLSQQRNVCQEPVQ